jgi:RimJ/RimL family protein N-acetyltransferase
LTRAHTEHVVALNSDPEVLRFILGRAMTRAEVLAELPGLVEDRGPGGALGLWAGFTGDDFAGVWFLSPDDEDPSAGETGWRLPRTAWGRGLATEGARALLDHGFGTVGLTRIRAETMAVNTASRRVMERLGMTHVRTYVGEWDDPLPGWEQGEVVYELAGPVR